MATDWNQLVPTRRSLLSRIKNWEDQASWTEFNQIYRPLILGAALKAGLTETEAEDAAQDTLVAVANAIRAFKYDRDKCTFKTWLHSITRRHVANQFRKRQGKGRVIEPLPGDPGDGVSSPVDDIPDPASEALEEVWDKEYEQNLMNGALERVRKRVSPAQFQIFEYYARQGHSAQETARAMGINSGQVYLAKLRVSAKVRTELNALKEMEEQKWEPLAQASRVRSAKS